MAWRRRIETIVVKVSGQAAVETYSQDGGQDARQAAGGIASPKATLSTSAALAGVLSK
jgi:hypothetical protein